MKSAVTLRRLLLASTLALVMTEVGTAGVYARRAGLFMSSAASRAPQSVITAGRYLAIGTTIASFVGLVAIFRWAGRVADNTVAQGAQHINPKMARWGWIIPIGQLWLGYNALRQIAQIRQAEPRGVGTWQALSIARVAVGIYALIAMRTIPLHGLGRHDALRDQCIRHAVVAALLTGILIAQAGVTKRLNAATGAD